MKIRTNSTLNAKMKRMIELKAEQKRIDDELNALQADIVKYMDKHDTDTVEGTEHTATYKMVHSSRVDSTKLKKVYPDIAKQFTVESSYKRFTLK